MKMKWIGILLLMVFVAHADDPLLNYSQCVNQTVMNCGGNNTNGFCNDTTSYILQNITICAPPQINTTCSPPPIVIRDLLFGQNASYNNFTATCQSWYDTNITTCPVCSFPPQVTLNLNYGQNTTVNNFTAICQAWSNASCPTNTVYINQTINQTIYANIMTGLENVTINVTPSKDAYDLYNPILNFHMHVNSLPLEMWVMNPGEVKNRTSDLGVLAMCSNSTAFCPSCPVCPAPAACPINQTSCAPYITNASCSAFWSNTSANCYDESVLSNCSLKVSMCLSDLADTFNSANGGACTTNDVLQGSIKTCMNQTLSNCQAQINSTQALYRGCQDNLTFVTGTVNNANTFNQVHLFEDLIVLLIGCGGAGIVVWYFTREKRGTEKIGHEIQGPAMQEAIAERIKKAYQQGLADKDKKG